MQSNDSCPAKNKKSELSEAVDNKYIAASMSDNTRRAYQADINHFQKNGRVLPATPEIIESYLREFAVEHNARTLARRLIALRQWHILQGYEDPTLSPLVQKTMRGISRLHGRPKTQALALRLEDLDKISAYLTANDSLISCRNRALMLVGFFGALRRSEIAALKWEQVQFVREGIVIILPRSKTDQEGQGQKCVIPFGNDSRCPVRALLSWQKQSKCFDGLVFRKISKIGNILIGGITAHHINRLIQTIVKEVGLPNSAQYSAHSLRRGFATEAARLGASMPAIQRHGRWKSTKTVVEYIEAGRQFSDSAVNVMFEWK